MCSLKYVMPRASSHSKAAITTRILGLVHQLCLKRIHVTKRDLFYTDVKLFEVIAGTGTWSL
jgi:DNA topoisomerase VI subunit A